MKSADHWLSQARQWQHIGGLLRPGAEDIALMRTILGQAGEDVPGLILGVTRELSVLSNELTAIDKNAGMIAASRVAYDSNHHKMVQADWRDLPFATEQFNFATGDGSFNSIDYADYGKVFAQLHRVLKPGSPVAIRLYESPIQSETVDQVMAAARNREIGSFHAFKWRLAMAIVAARGQPDIPVAEIHSVFTGAAGDRDALAADAGWPRSDIDTIDSYDGSPMIYSFPTFAQFKASALAAGWMIESRACGTYELAERCPVIGLRAISSRSVSGTRPGDSAFPAAAPLKYSQRPLSDLMALMRRLDDMQWMSADNIRHQQYRQLVTLISYAAAESPGFAARLKAAGLSAKDCASPDHFTRLPPLTRAALQAQGADLFCRNLPSGHNPLREMQTSGATGEPVTIYRTEATQHIWAALTLRDHAWHERDFSGTLAIIRANVPPDGHFPDWGQPVALFHPSGPMHTTLLNRDIAEQGQWLLEIDPIYLVTYPTNLAALIDWFREKNIRLKNLREIRTVGETLPPVLRKRVRDELGVKLTDTYSSNEAGVIALQCPDSGLYHIMADNLIVEILDEDDKPCPPGVAGRVVVTDLHNFATPLIRYAIGDYAESGPACPCGRGLPTLTRILGRTRNMLRLPDGNRRWPLVGFQEYRDVAPIRQYQLIQTALNHIEMHLAVSPQLTPAQEKQMKKIVMHWLDTDFPFNFTFVYYPDRLPMPANGKFEEFICRVPDDTNNMKA